MLWCKRGEAVEKRKGGGGCCCLRADHGMGSGKLVELHQGSDRWFRTTKTLLRVQTLQFLLDKDTTQSSWQIHVFQSQESSTL